mmetsp:Transcript_23343/g.54272  ORF Transcript_23343/g.54272 Transcript_23343/m.54272 type:complete len:272 (-) Transcript_23343:8-823(-)
MAAHCTNLRSSLEEHKRGLMLLGVKHILGLAQPRSNLLLAVPLQEVDTHENVVISPQALLGDGPALVCLLPKVLCLDHKRHPASHLLALGRLACRGKVPSLHREFLFCDDALANHPQSHQCCAHTPEFGELDVGALLQPHLPLDNNLLGVNNLCSLRHLLCHHHLAHWSQREHGQGGQNAAAADGIDALPLHLHLHGHLGTSLKRTRGPPQPHAPSRGQGQSSRPTRKGIGLDRSQAQDQQCRHGCTDHLQTHGLCTITVKGAHPRVGHQR